MKLINHHRYKDTKHDACLGNCCIRSGSSNWFATPRCVGTTTHRVNSGTTTWRLTVWHEKTSQFHKTNLEWPSPSLNPLRPGAWPSTQCPGSLELLFPAVVSQSQTCSQHNYSGAYARNSLPACTLQPCRREAGGISWSAHCGGANDCSQ